MLVDEAQNLEPTTLKTILTRVGEGTKIVFTGDTSQIDAPYLSEHNNAVSVLIDAFAGESCFGHVRLTPCERSDVRQPGGRPPLICSGPDRGVDSPVMSPRRTRPAPRADRRPGRLPSHEAVARASRRPASSGRQAVIEDLEASGLRGRGGAGFPTGTKWRTVAANASPTFPTTVVVNGAEGEPGSFKDRAIMRRTRSRCSKAR